MTADGEKTAGDEKTAGGEMTAAAGAAEAKASANEESDEAESAQVEAAHLRPCAAQMAIDSELPIMTQSNVDNMSGLH